jgi:hypothetical protein
MNRILRIIKIFSKKEIQIIEKYISSTSKSKKRYLLFKLLREERKYTEEEISNLIFGNISLDSLKKLEERLLLDIEDVILLFFKKSIISNSYEQDKLNTITLLLTGQFYLQNGLYSETYKKLRKAKKLINDHNFIFLDHIYFEIYGDYLNRTCNNSLGSTLKESLNVLSELQYIHGLKLNGLKINPEISSLESNNPPVLEGDIKIGDYSKCLSKLTQIKYLIYNGKAEKAEIIYNSVLSAKDDWINKVPHEMYVEILLQKVKINIINESFVENIKLIENIKKIGIISDKNIFEYLKIRLINFFILGHYDVCKSISFYFFSDKKIKGNISNEITYQWIYFNICLAFINGQHADVLKMISQFPGYTYSDKNISLNIRILEIYLLTLLGRDEIAFSKILSIKQFLLQIDIPTKNRYNYLMDRICEFIGERSQEFLPLQSLFTANFKDANTVPKQDYLGMELISFEMFESMMKIKMKKIQIAN